MARLEECRRHFLDLKLVLNLNMSHLSVKSSLNENTDGSAIITIELCPVAYKTFKHLANDPCFWVENAVQTRVSIEAERIVTRETNKHLENGTMPINVTKASLILDAELPE